MNSWTWAFRNNALWSLQQSVCQKTLCVLRCNPSTRVAPTKYFTLAARSKHRELKPDTAEHDNDARRKTAASRAQRDPRPRCHKQK